MAKTKGADQPVAVENDWRRRVTFDFPSTETPKEFKELSVGDEVTIMVTGKVKRLSSDQDSYGEEGKKEKVWNSLAIQVEDLDFTNQKVKLKTMKEAVDAAKKTM